MEQQQTVGNLQKEFLFRKKIKLKKKNPMFLFNRLLLIFFGFFLIEKFCQSTWIFVIYLLGTITGS